MRAPRVVLMGSMGSQPFAGMAWQVLHYLEGLRRLGYHVHYVEDTGGWPYDAEQNTLTDDCGYTVRYIAQLMEWCDLPDRWAYQLGSETFGLSDQQLAGVFDDADALINLTGSTVLREEHLRVPVRIYLETDPVMPQIEVAQGRQFTIDLLGAHTHHFTYGENLGGRDCQVPLDCFAYLPTRQPVVLDWWTAEDGPARDGRFTTIASWRQDGKDIEWNGETYYWSKHLEFLKILDLPRRTERALELALACGDPDATQLLHAHGWRTVDASIVSKDITSYRDYILGSSGEFTVAKDQNIRLRSGWFSDRSACYLAAGKPVITQDTAFGNSLPTGNGLFSFREMGDILDAFETIESDPRGHEHAAREIAAEYFAAEKVVADLMAGAGC
ncbi:MAG TPA: hypothetical protein VF221_14465 [Chloroflexota bacterium]